MNTKLKIKNFQTRKYKRDHIYIIKRSISFKFIVQLYL